MPQLLLIVLALGPARVPAADEPPTDKVNKKIDRVALTDLEGKPVALSEVAGKNATVVVFLSFDCPVSTSYSTTLNELVAKYAEKGVALIGVVPTDDPSATVKKQAAEYKLTFPVFTDPKLMAADAVKAVTVPEAFVLDQNSFLRYRGRIDDAYSARLKKNASVTSHDLRDAIEAILTGADVKTPATKAIGCPVGNRTLAVKPGAAVVTYHKDVQPIIQNNCQGCHRPGQVGPFSLTNYRQALNWAEDIKDYTTDRRMPPWKPSSGVEFANARHLSDKDIQTLAAWVDAGCPQGDPKDAPPPPKFTDGWELGKPDLVLEVPEEFHVGAAGHDIFRCFVLPTGMTEDKYIIAYEVKPGNPRVVHHTLNFWDTSGQARKLIEKEKERLKKPGEADHGPGYSVGMGIGFLPMPDPKRPGQATTGGFGGWAPGQLASQLPPGAGFFLPAGADVVIQTHYHRTGKPETDRTKIGLYFAKKPIEKVYQSIPVSPPNPTARQMIGLDPAAFQIPAGVAAHTITGSVWLQHDATLYSVLPHMHLIGKSIKVTMTPPGGETVTLIDIKDWDYNWQETYWFKKPIPVKAGTRLEVTGIYNNSLSNPHNPFNPPQTIKFGEQTTNEMLFGFVGLTPVGPDRVRISRTDPAKAPKK